MINLYINDIRKSLESECYFSALSLALMMPDICGMAEYPSKEVGERYIKWCDNFLCPYLYGDDDNKGLSGESLYGLRNVYLHQGSVKIDSDKMKNKDNRIDKFILVVGKNQILNEFNVVLSSGKGDTLHRAEVINVTYLCLTICDCVQNYYDANENKFSFDYNVMPEKYLFPSYTRKGGSDLEQIDKEFDVMQFANHLPEIRKIIQGYVDNIDIELSDVTLKETKKEETSKEPKKPKKTKSEYCKKTVVSKRENQIRSYFGRHFKKQFYKDNKETIIKAVLNSKTKQQVNNKLQKAFPNKVAGEIYQKLLPFIKDMSGK